MSQHVVVIGAVALGPKAACRFKRLEPGSRVTMLDESDVISYGGCGIPYYVSGEVADEQELRTTSFHMVRDVQFFKDVKGVDVMPRTRAVEIDRDARKVKYKNLATGESGELEYDQLVIATGATPRKLNLPGEDLKGVHYVSNPHDAVAIKEAIAKGEVNNAVVVGAGFIGLEMAEAFTDLWGVDTTVFEIFDQIMPRLVSPEMARMTQEHMEEQGVQFHLGENIKALEGDGRVQRVVTDKRTVEAECVIISVGVVPNDGLARDAGLECNERGGIVVDETMRTTDPAIFSGGDCVVVKNLVTGQPAFLPLGSMANRQGRVVGDNLAGGSSKFDGVLGSFVVKTFETSLAGTGLSLESAKAAGLDAASVLLVSLDRAHFYPSKDLMTLELVYEKGTRKVLGIQGFGNAGDAMVGRINAVAAAMKFGLTIDELSTMELAYAPPFSSAMDVLNSVANMADNAERGLNRGVGPEGFEKLWEQRDSGDYCFLDCREAPDAEPFMEKHPEHWCNIPQGEIYKRFSEIPEDKTVVLVCNTGARAYEAQIMLDHKGVKDAVTIRGGMAALKKWGMDV